jgi:hypothetical protein
MYIKLEDFAYFEDLSKTLKEEQRKNFIALLKKITKEKEVDKIVIVTDEYLNTHGINPSDFITKTQIKKLYKEVKSGKPS